MEFSSLATSQVVKMTTCNSARDENFIKMKSDIFISMSFNNVAKSPTGHPGHAVITVMLQVTITSHSIYHPPHIIQVQIKNAAME